MAVVALPAEQAAELRAAPFNYEHVGETAHERRVAGYGWMDRSTTLRRTDFEAAASDLLSWRLQERAGLRVQASESPLQTDTVVLMRLGIGPLSLRIPCRVVYVIDQPHLRGFAYGTLPGHPEAGEERFVLEQHVDETISLTITAFSRPASRLSRLGGPVTRRVQEVMTVRYLRGLDRP
jgi:uncharacterized protein (UPF0548 family)